MSVNEEGYPEIKSPCEVCHEPPDEPFWDQTDFCHPAYRRGCDSTLQVVVKKLNEVLDRGKIGTFGDPGLDALAVRLDGLRK